MDSGFGTLHGEKDQINDEWLHSVYVKGPLVRFVVRGDLEQPKQSWCMGLSCPVSNDRCLWLSK